MGKLFKFYGTFGPKMFFCVYDEVWYGGVEWGGDREGMQFS